MDEFKLDIRSILGTQKHGCDLPTFRKLYKDITGQNLPFWAQSIDDLNRRYPDVVRISHNRDRNLRVMRAVPCLETAHIDRLVSCQKGKPKPIRVAAPNPLRRFHPTNQQYRSVIARRFMGSSARPAPPSTYPSKPQSRTVPLTMPTLQNFTFSPSTRLVRTPTVPFTMPTVQSQVVTRTTPKTTPTVSAQAKNKTQATTSPILSNQQPLMSCLKPLTPPPAVNVPTSSTVDVPNLSTADVPSLSTVDVLRKSPEKLISEKPIEPQEIALPQTDSFESSAKPFVPKELINLTPPITPDTEVAGDIVESPGYSLESSSNNEPDYQMSSSCDYRAKLAQLVADRDLGKPTYFSYTAVTKAKKFIYLSRVVVDCMSWCSYPEVIVSSPDDAEECAAKKAYLDFLKIPVKRLSKSLTDSSIAEKKELIDRLVMLIKNSKFNAFDVKVVPQEFFKFHNVAIPLNWMDIVKEFPRDVHIEEIEFASTIVKTNISIPSAVTLKRLDEEAKKKEDDERQQKKQAEDKIAAENLAAVVEAARKLQVASGVDSNTGGQSTQLLPPNLNLPSTQYWNVLLLGVTENNEVLMRLAETSDAYLDFLNKLALIYANDDRYFVSSHVIPGRIYATINDNSVLRVQALDENDEEVHCVYVDEGGSDYVPKSSLREIPDDVAQLPFQAFKCLLDHMNEFANDRKVGFYIQKLIDKAGDNGLVLVAEPTSRNHPIKVLLYNTSMEEDVLINDCLYNLIVSSEGLNLDLD